MAVGTKSNQQIYEEQFFGGMNEVLAQNANIFNAASRNSVRLFPRSLKGDFSQESFMQAISEANLIARRDVTDASSSTTDQPLTQDEIKSVKINRRIGPIANTVDSMKKIGENMGTFMFMVGQQTGVAQQLDYLHMAVRACEATLDKQTTTEFDASDGTLNSSDLVDGLNVLGDRASRIVCWVMHSKVYHDLVKNQIAANVDGLTEFNIRTGIPVTLDRPVIITDESVLKVSGSPDNYITLGLTADAVHIIQSEEQTLWTENVTGVESLFTRIQGEFSYNVRVKGFKWGSTVNPTDANVADSSNWTLAANDVKDGPGVRILSQ